MDRRYIYFMVAVVLILGTHFGLRMLFAPPEPVAKKEDPKVVQNKADKEKKDKEAKAKAGGPAPGEEKQDKSKKPAVDAAGEKPAVVKPASGAPHKLVSLGSVDEASGFVLHAILNSMGAAVERVEVASQAHRDIDDASGYLGHLGLVDEKDTVKVGVVGAGTPAALAKEASGKVKGGLAAGDILTSLGGTPLADASAAEEYLTKKTKPGDELEVKITRLIDGKSTPLTFTALLTRRPVQIIRPEIHIVEGQVQHDPLSFLFTLESLVTQSGTKSIASGEDEIRGLPSIIGRNWTLEKSTADSAEFSLTLTEEDLKGIGQTGSLKLIKRFKLAGSDAPAEKRFHLDLEIEIQNVGKENVELAYRFSGATGLPLEGWWYSNKLHTDMWAAAGARDIASKIHDGPHHLLAVPKIYSDAKAAFDKGDPAEQSLFVGDNAQSFDYVGGDTQFYAAVLMPQPDGDTPVTFARAFARPVQDLEAIDKQHIKTMNNTCVLVSPARVLEPGKSLSTKFQVFLGPKEQEVLEQYGLGRLIERGWSYAAYPAWVLQRLLHGLTYLTYGNYGIAIILLTVLVRSCMIPLSLKQARSAAKMQELAPEMTKIKEKYKDDMEKQSTALRELYAKHKFNPFGGCLPVFLQLPIFVGLYRCLSVDIALRDADLIPGFFWASNLAGPDKLLFWKDWVPTFIGDEAHGYLGPFFNLLPVFTCVLFIVQQKLFTPPATDEQTAMQQKMMMYMTVFMGIMFFKVPAGLCIYFITSSLWSIVERTCITKPKRVPPAGGDGKSEGGGKDSRSAKPSPNGAGGNGTTKKVKK